MQFNQHIDGASVILIYPLCEKVLKKESAIQFANSTDRMSSLHIKTLAASVLSLLSEITIFSDFQPFIVQIEDILVKNLQDTNEEIRKSCAISLASIVTKSYSVAKQLQDKLLEQIMMPNQKISMYHGLSMAIVYLSFQLNNWQELIQQVQLNQYIKLNILSDMRISCKCGKSYIIKPLEIKQCECGEQVKVEINQNMKDADLIAISLYLLYIPQKIIEIHDVELTESFVENNLKLMIELAFQLVTSKQYTDNGVLIQNILRQLCTSFLLMKRDCEIIGQILADKLLHWSYNVRHITIQIVGDVISEIGSTVLEKSSNKQEKDEIKQIKQQLNEIKVSGLVEEKQIKVFIPEKAIDYAMQMLSHPIYYNLVLNLFIARCDQTSNLRHAAVNMWKLITVKPLTTMTGFTPLIKQQLINLLKLFYEEKSTEFNYKELVQSTVHELMQNMNHQLFSQFCESLDVAIKDNVDDLTLVCLLDIFAAVAKNDKKNLYIKESLIYDLPSFIKNAADDRLINSAAFLLSSLQTDVSALLDNIVQPQIAKIQQVQPEDISKLAQSINLIIGTRITIVEQLIKECVDKLDVNSNYQIFVTEFFKISKLLQDNPEVIIQYLTSKLQASGKEIVEVAITQLKSNKDIETVHPCFFIIKQMLQNLQCYQIVIDNAFITILNSVPDVLVPSCLLLALCIRQQPTLSAENIPLISSSIQACFSNIHVLQFSGAFGYLISSLGYIYGQIKGDDDLQKSYAQLLISQSHTTLLVAAHARSSKFPCLLQQFNKCAELGQVCCALQSPTVKVQSEAIRNQALNLMILLMLSCLNSFVYENQDCETKSIKYDDYIFQVPKNSEQQKCVFLLATGLAGRIVMTYRQQLTEEHRIQLLKSTAILAQIAPIQQFESAIRPEIEKTCLLNNKSMIQDESINSLFELFSISNKQEQNVHSLLNILLKNNEQQAIELNYDLSNELIVKIIDLLSKMIRVCKVQKISMSYRQTDLKFTKENLYEEIIQLIWFHVMLTENQFRKHAAILLGECCNQLNSQPQILEVMLMQTLYKPTDSILVSCSQLLMMQNILRISIEKQTNIIQFVQHAAENISAIAPDLQNTTLNKFIESKLQIQTESQQEEVAELCKVLSFMLVLGEQGQVKQQPIIISIVKAIDNLKKRFNQLTSHQQLSVLEAMMIFDKFGQNFSGKLGLKVQVGLYTLAYHQKCLMSQASGVAEYAQMVLVEFYGLRFGSQNFETVAKTLKQNNQAMVEDMEYRVQTLLKLIKAGKL
uniref:Translational activator GCN1 n=1 Tax=Trepomonas sp. PC1 TaxID=1076344 RepID=A0A146KBQ0_9EUKA|eukprot:JAP93967.1 Translational activator GCN1 [Trepomonas sp. PC1]